MNELTQEGKGFKTKLLLVVAIFVFGSITLFAFIYPFSSMH